jgi:hypothetical protein
MMIVTLNGWELLRKTQWVTTDIIVQLLRGRKSETSTNRQPIAIYSNKNRTRHSKRLRQAHENEKRRLAVTKKTTIKDIKVKVSADTLLSDFELTSASNDRFKKNSIYPQSVSDFFSESKSFRIMR